MNFGIAYQEYKQYAIKRHKKQSFKSISQDFELKVLPYFKDYDIFLLTEKDILRWKDTILTYNYSNSYNDRLYYCFSIFLDYCCLYYDLPTNVVRSVGNFKPKIEVIKRDYYSLSEFKLFIKNLDHIVYKSFFTLMFYTGTRPSEAMALKFSDINGKYIRVDKSIERRGNREISTPKNIYSIRNILISRKVKKCLKLLKKYYFEIYGEFKNDYFIFGGKKPLAPTTIDRYKKLACKKANLRTITEHQFRHSFATYLISRNIPINVVSKLLGHSNVETTARIYIQQDLTQEKRVLRTLNSISFKSISQNFKRILLKHF